jgi:hypothetical protein
MAETTRVRTTFKGLEAKDECPHCAPQSFEKFASVRDGQITMAHEYDHTRYRFKDGIPQITDEGLQDLEDAACKTPTDDDEAYQKAVAKKRQNRKTSLTPAEIEICVNRARRMLEPAESC